ncbi:hypothetical protein T4C_11742 [Trichinella pseudospiralis]|uniref:Uncharacterized protein n=1 Tax=Trichinella pseudospiralis TaxID=6337 RepID=A0A0V1IQM5_TRIPS|nr:hypothetical protein T4C_11742 [Trichinella pseudospiralis]
MALRQQNSNNGIGHEDQMRGTVVEEEGELDERERKSCGRCDTVVSLCLRLFNKLICCAARNMENQIARRRRKPQMDNVQATVLGLSLPNLFDDGDFKRWLLHFEVFAEARRSNVITSWFHFWYAQELWLTIHDWSRDNFTR